MVGVKSAVAGFILAAAFALPAKAQTTFCFGSNSGNCAAVFPSANGGQQEVWTQPKKVLTDDFGVSTLNVINKFQTPTTANGGVAAANGTCPGAACGAAVMGTGTTANGQSFLATQLVFQPRNPGYYRFQTNINLPAPGTINQFLSWGFSNITTGTTGLSAANPCGTANSGGAAAAFGLSTAGKLQAYTCASGNFLLIADLSAPQGSTPIQTSSGIWTGGCSCTPQPPDTQSYKYVMDNLGDNVIWYTEQPDGTLRRVAFFTRGAAGPDVNALPVTYMALGGATPPAVSSTIQINQISVADTAGNPIAAVHTAASNSTGVVLKAAPGNLISIEVTNLTAAIGYLLVANSATVPSGTPTIGTASGNVQKCIAVPANGYQNVTLAPQPYEAFSVGISAIFSSANCTTTIAGVAASYNAAVE